MSFRGILGITPKDLQRWSIREGRDPRLWTVRPEAPEYFKQKFEQYRAVMLSSDVVDLEPRDSDLEQRDPEHKTPSSAE